MLGIISALLFYTVFICFLCVAANRHNKTLSDYVLGDRHLSAPITALGVGASDMGGWLLLALPGAFFTYGVNQCWMPIGLTIGAYLNWLFIAKRLRIYTELANNSLTLSAFYANRFMTNMKAIRAVSAITIIIFFTIYCASGFISGALLFQVMLGIHFTSALYISAGIIIFYVVLGGFLAINWIDFFQGSLMFFALLIVPIVGTVRLIQAGTFTEHLQQLPQHYTDLTHTVPLLSILSLLGWGLGYFGQPHLLMRFMAVKKATYLVRARRICMIWMIIALIGAMATGFIGHLFFSGQLPTADQVFLKLAGQLFPSFIAGLLFSAVLSAFMSTVAAQLLVSSSALIVDFYQPYCRSNASNMELLFMSRLCVVLCAAVGLYLALHSKEHLLALVSYAWGGIGAAFGPATIMSLYWKKTTSKSIIAGIIMGAITCIIWKSFLIPLGGIWAIYEIIPAFSLSLLTIYFVSLIDATPETAIQQTFMKMKSMA